MLHNSKHTRIRILISLLIQLAPRELPSIDTLCIKRQSKHEKKTGEEKKTKKHCLDSKHMLSFYKFLIHTCLSLLISWELSALLHQFLKSIWMCLFLGFLSLLNRSCREVKLMDVSTPNWSLRLFYTTNSHFGIRSRRIFFSCSARKHVCRIPKAIRLQSFKRKRRRFWFFCSRFKIVFYYHKKTRMKHKKSKQTRNLVENIFVWFEFEYQSRLGT